MRINCGPCAIRTFTPGDADSLAEHANDREVWLWVRDRFPHPYTRAHADEYIAMALGRTPPQNLAIEVDGRVVGGVSVFPQTDIERVSAEIGYWLGRAYWGRGIMTPVVRAMTRYAIDTFQLTRVFATLAATNAGSVRVLEKAGFVREGFMKQSAIKDGVIHDQYMYGFYA